MKKGVALLWVLVLSTVLMIISGTMVNTIIKESRFSISIEDSVKAYAAAKTGIDWGAAELANEKSTVAAGTIIIEKDAAGAAIVTTDVTINRTTKIVTSTGKSGNVRRRLEYHSTSNLGTRINPSKIPNDTPVGPLNESFTLQFDFWGKPNTSEVVFGLRNTAAVLANSTQMSLVMYQSKLYLQVYDSDTGVGSKFNVIDINTKAQYQWISNADPYQYRATIKYVKDTSAVLTIRKREEYKDPIDGETKVKYTCVAEATADLTALSMHVGTFNSLLVSGPSPTTYVASDTDYADPYMGDGEYIEYVTSATTFVRVDNIQYKDPSKL